MADERGYCGASQGFADRSMGDRPSSRHSISNRQIPRLETVLSTCGISTRLSPNRQKYELATGRIAGRAQVEGTAHFVSNARIEVNGASLVAGHASLRDRSNLADRSVLNSNRLRRRL